MYTLFVILTIFCAVLLIGIVLIQKSKGGGLSSSFAGSNQVMGVRRTNDFIEKMTWYLAGAIALFSILSSYTMPNANESKARTSSGSAQTVKKTDFGSKAPAVGNTAPAADVPVLPVDNTNAEAADVAAPAPVAEAVEAPAEVAPVAADGAAETGN